MNIQSKIDELFRRVNSIGRGAVNAFTWTPGGTPPELPVDATPEQRQLHATLASMDATIPAEPGDSGP